MVFCSLTERCWLNLCSLSTPQHRSKLIPPGRISGFNVDALEAMQQSAALLGYTFNMSFWYHPLENYTETPSLAAALSQYSCLLTPILMNQDRAQVRIVCRLTLDIHFSGTQFLCLFLSHHYFHQLAPLAHLMVRYGCAAGRSIYDAFCVLGLSGY